MLYAWESFDNGEWNIIAAIVGPIPAPIPLVTSRQNLAETLRPVAEKHGRDHDQQVRLMAFMAFEDLT